ncbi:Uncharacterised protein [uncultured Clostridium sp.]|uniref:hypothetical protein n=1 Tax=uncultured Clostridium sp. TaxID=59620 RepID=UPI0008233E93|nr:hypothetical protein [uncultured Clostridium sp.]SCJ98985.1 Uncharacterised protein [uncultured Clostridium sp.]
MEKSELRLRDFPKIHELAQMYVEVDGMGYKDAIKKAKEKLSSERVGAHKSDNNISKTFKDSITENIEIRK